jgi:hypothetical protein
MQRVCKYELLLKNVLAQHFKQLQANKDTPIDNKDADLCIDLQCQIETLSSIIQKIDRKRAEADRWDKVCRLEERLALNEPLRKKGRFIVHEGQYSVRDGNNSSSTECSIVFFNDLLIRATTSKKAATGTSSVHALLPMSQIVVVDFNSRFSDAKTLALANTDPRYGDWFRIEFATEADRNQWVQSFSRYSLSIKQLCCDWSIPLHDLTDEVVLCADRCCWKQAYVNKCHILITTHHLCMCWEAFGSTERETIPLSSVTSFKRQGSDGLDIIIDGWKGLYQFTDLISLDLTILVLEVGIRRAQVAAAIAVASTPSATPNNNNNGNNKSLSSENVLSRIGSAPRVDVAAAPTCMDLDPLLMDEADLLQLWKEGDTLSYVNEETILLPDTRNINVYQILTGSVTVKDADGQQVAILAEGDLFGVRSFLDGRKAGITVTGGGAGVTVIALHRPSILEQLADNPRLLAKFMAMLGCKVALGSL